MKRILCSLAALALCTPLLARAAEGWVVADISLQAGPDTDYPSIAELDAGTPVSIQGCIDGWTWCDVIVGEDRGWVPGTFLEEEVGGRPVVIVDYGPRIGIPIVSFSIGAYWDRHYHNRPFYAERQRFESHQIGGAPPRPATIVATAPRPDARPRPASGATMQGGATVQRSTTQMQGTTGATATQAAPTNRERATAQQRIERKQVQPSPTATETQTATAQREHRAGQTPRAEQPASATPSDRQTAQREHPAAKPSDNAPQMMPRERPTGTAPQAEQHQTQIARNATPHDQKPRDQHQGPKPKDELKKSDKKKDNGDNGGGDR